MRTIEFTTDELQTLIISLIFANSTIRADIDQEEADRLSDKLAELNLECGPENDYKVVVQAG